MRPTLVWVGPGVIHVNIRMRFWLAVYWMIVTARAVAVVAGFLAFPPVFAVTVFAPAAAVAVLAAMVGVGVVAIVTQPELVGMAPAASW